MGVPEHETVQLEPLFSVQKLEARGGIEPPIELLQSSALPLGYRALGNERGS